jgi:hypothetical protein
VTTDYEFLVLERFQGAVGEGEGIHLRLPGGLVRFDNGTTAEWRLAHMPPLRLGDEAVVFVRRAVDDGDGVFRLVSTQHGIYRFDAAGRVATSASSSSGLAKKFGGVSKEDFLASVRGATLR